MLSTFRKDFWPSRDAAAEEFKASRFHQKWDPRALEQLLRHEKGKRIDILSRRHMESKTNGLP
jgi:hypothetical protein